ncbi:MAG: glycosyltransferase family 4 protein, partial [bacterium]
SMKIAIVHPSLATKGGAENVVVWLAEELARRDHAVTVFTTDYDEQFYGRRSDRPFAIETLDLGGYVYDPIRFLQAGWRLRNRLTDFDCVNPHNFPAYVWARIARAANPRVGPIVWFCEEPVRWFYPEVSNPHILRMFPREEPAHGSLAAAIRRVRYWRREWKWEVARVLDRWAVPGIDLILANSEFIAGQVRAIFGVEARACLLGIPLRRFTTAPAATKTGGPPATYALTVSRLFPEKNVGTILRALRLLLDRGRLPFDRYVVAGDGPMRESLEEQARGMGLEHVVEFAGFVSEAHLARLYEGASLVIYLPLDETYGLVFPEAALFRKAVIGPNHGGPSEIVRHGVTGFQVDPTDPALVAATIESCFREPGLLRQLGEAAHAYVTAKLSFPRFVDRFEAELRRRFRPDHALKRDGVAAEQRP